MEFKDLHELKRAAAAVLAAGEPLRVIDAAALRERFLEPLVRTAIFAPDPALREASRALIQAVAGACGIWSASIQDLYAARGRGEISGFTVPATNIRGLTYDTARAAFRAARALHVGPLVFEIARSEIGYTEQAPAEYSAAVTAAAIREGHRGPIFLQGDHFQINAKKFAQAPDAEVRSVKDLIQAAIEARFLNIDIDTSTLVDLSHPTVAEQQRTNVEVGADLAAHVRRLQPAGVDISIGGEIGEVGKQNSTVEELRAYMDGFRENLARRGGGLTGISKISVQTGTSHGGVPLPDGTVASVKVDFDTLRDLSRVARQEYGLAGAVQHGASTLPEEAFDHFPRVETAEIHLATGFQNLLYEHPAFGDGLRREVREFCFRACADERKAGETDEQFVYKTRKKAFGPLKRKMWDLSPSDREAIGRSLEERFAFLFRKLGVVDTLAHVERTIRRVDLPPTIPLPL